MRYYVNEVIDKNFSEDILYDNSQFFNLSFILLVLPEQQMKYCIKTFCQEELAEGKKKFQKKGYLYKTLSFLRIDKYFYPQTVFNK